MGFAAHLLLYVTPFSHAWFGCMACAPHVPHGVVRLHGMCWRLLALAWQVAWQVLCSKRHGKRQRFGLVAGAPCCHGRCPSVCPSVCTRQPISVCPSVCPSVCGSVVRGRSQTAHRSHLSLLVPSGLRAHKSDQCRYRGGGGRLQSC